LQSADEYIRLNNVTKRFGGVTALDGVSFSVRNGEVHAIVGENGAGKSTLMKLLAGVHAPDSGRLVLRGQPVRFSGPLDARRAGVSIVFQELNLFPHRSVAANVFANRELKNAAGLLDRARMREQTRTTLESMGVDIAPDAPVGPLSVGEKQLVEIARALQQQSDVLILDEPNSALSEHESQRLFEIVRRLRGQGVTVLYVSHRLEEVFAIADRITVIRDGRYQGTVETAQSSIPQIIAAMIGRPAAESPFPGRPPVPADAPVLLSVRKMRKGPRLGPVSFDARAGEILGFAGLEGSGVDDVFHALFGLDRMTDGEIVYLGQPRRVRSPLQAIRLGLGLIPASRREQGLMMDWSVRRNATLLVLDKLLNRLGLVDAPAARRTTEDYVRRLNVATDTVDKRVVNLSGGNQQKVLLAKWLAAGPKVLILNDPTRGVDVGAKAEIYQLCDQLARQGLAILFTSSEGEEIVGLCDRVLVFYKGKVLKELSRGQAAKAELMHLVAGGA
jgi:ABC-type sugar transport system ATPase subunit